MLPDLSPKGPNLSAPVTTATDVSDLDATVLDWFADFSAALAETDPATAAQRTTDLFLETGFWRDLVTFTWNLHTAEGHEAIADLVTGNHDRLEITDVALDGEATDEGDGVTCAFVTFNTPLFVCRGVLRLKDGKAFTLLTSARELHARPEYKGRKRILGAEHGVHENRKNWADRRAERRENLGYTEQPFVVIIGGGQGGIALASRLKRLRVPTLVVEASERPGDQWRGRYHSLCLHDPVWYDHLPYLPFPDDWPIFTPKDKMGDWLEHYVGIMDLDYWTKSTCQRASYDEASGTWDVVVDRDGEQVVLKPTQLVMATGMSGVPNRPTFPGQEDFRGEIRHSSEHPGGETDRGRRVVVLGANNSAHDICADLYENGAHPVMIQRSSTYMVRSESFIKHVVAPLYSEDALDAGVDTDRADLTFASLPYKILPEGQKAATAAIKEEDADYYAGLEKAGFMLDFGDDDSGLFPKYLRRGSGYYIDVGAGQLVADGSIELHSNVSIDHYTADGVVLTDGTELAADVVVLATGYGSMNGWAEKLISPEVADKVGRCWGLGSDTTKDPGPWEGELRNMWKPTQQENLWFMGGNLHQGRHYSRYLSLQLAARHEGIDTPVYKLAPVHHTS
ncbi:MAG TPA: NAD(P)/FAD-dependent oxidoreductase [Candidatus Corynebacterium faecigallinarum]|uniref:NAD(P)/FAD-dependent oxidoreductase n=1 Tax=Candidatus Corynebacterium faecigallinarum TaxID=2838528 RepID=A0A9D2TPS7_9CORY|nr:NAD(P)/FAD-dependent oxidoreductase [Candidatus Corynebacterium faecigallinarum]